MGKLDDMRRAAKEGPKPKPVEPPPKGKAEKKPPPKPVAAKVASLVAKAEPSPKGEKPIKVEATGDYVTHACNHRVGLAQYRETKCPTCVRLPRVKKIFANVGHQHADKRLPDGSAFAIDPFAAANEDGPPRWAGTLTVPGYPPFAAARTGLWPLLRALDRMYREAVRAAVALESRTRCSCLFAHPPHDWCDGNPNGDMPPHRVLAKDVPPQPGDDEPVDPQKPDGPRWGELFGRPRADKPVE